MLIYIYRSTYRSWSDQIASPPAAHKIPINSLDGWRSLQNANWGGGGVVGVGANEHKILGGVNFWKLKVTRVKRLADCSTTSSWIWVSIGSHYPRLLRSEQQCNTSWRRRNWSAINQQLLRPTRSRASYTRSKIVLPGNGSNYSIPLIMIKVQTKIFLN